MTAAQSDRHDRWPFGAAIALWRVVSSCDGLTWLAVAAGLTLRVLEYADQRGLYLDETYLLPNLVERPVLDFGTLWEHQLVPPGFLVLERLMVRLPINRVLAARLLPLVFSLASLFLFRAVARRYLDRRAVPLAMTLFALSDYLLYYSAEIKQYSLDVSLTLAALLLAASPGPATPRRLAVLALLGALAVWFSHPIALVLGGVGIHQIGSAALGKCWRDALAATAVSTCWAISFAGCLVVSNQLLDRDSFMWTWWSFAFIPFPPRSVTEAIRCVCQVINVFINPAWIVTPLGSRASALLATGLFASGMVALGKRWRGGLFLLVAPIGFAVLASVLHKYPFHGRLLLYLIPTIHLLIAEGTLAVGRRAGTIVLVSLVATLLVGPVTDQTWKRSLMRRTHGPDTHGDLYPDLLDEPDGSDTLMLPSTSAARP